ncbi:hypothetical protein J7E88_34765 [Streptomyces sp. ISL-10]|uniref:DUF7919 family protein n=1 Tax=Streptomyces sp. ISL-10 TaxID=2819172 RepID=UPI001BE568E8|nr:hypothetical protein [Streptomyces sp. ISL-10]MBT2370299.1 hypothetical protein [Streptomyces sp. ISL-10]
MTHYADLTPYTYDRDNWDPTASGVWQGVTLLNIGWLDRGKTYAKGAPPPGLVEALKGMTRTHRAQQTAAFTTAHGAPRSSPPGASTALGEAPRYE